MPMLNLNRNVDNYKKNQVATATGGQLIIMLYDGAIRFLKKSLKDIENKDMEASHNHITRARKIVLELMFSLDMDKGGEIAGNLYELYFFINQELIKANLKKDGDVIDECITLLDDLRSTWKDVLNQKTGQAEPATGIDIKN
jgi:flagellar protein FliS